MSSLQRKTRKRTHSSDDSFTSRFKTVMSDILPQNITQWFKGLTSSNNNGSVPMDDSSDSSSDDEVIENVLEFEPVRKKQRFGSPMNYSPHSELLRMDSEHPHSSSTTISQVGTNNLQEGVTKKLEGQTSKKNEFTMSNNYTLTLTSSLNGENEWKKSEDNASFSSKLFNETQSIVSKNVPRVDDSEKGAGGNDHKFKYFKPNKSSVVLTPSYVNLTSATQYIPKMKQTEKTTIEAPLTVKNCNNTITYSSTFITDLLENISSPLAEAKRLCSFVNVQKYSPEGHSQWQSNHKTSRNKTQELYVANNAALMQLKLKSRLMDPTNTSREVYAQNLREDNTAEERNQSNDLAGSKKQENFLKTVNAPESLPSVVLENDESQKNNTVPKSLSSLNDTKDEDVMFTFSKPVAAASVISYHNPLVPHKPVLNFNPSNEKTILETRVLESNNNWKCSECWVSNKSDVGQCICCGNKNSPIAAADSTPITNIPDVTMTEVKKTEMTGQTVSSKTTTVLNDSFKEIIQEQEKKWECRECLTRNNNSSNKCTCCDAEKLSQPVDSFKKIIQTQSEKWECKMCLTRNDNSKNKCICCESEKPSQPVDSFKKIIQTQSEKWECKMCLTRNDNGKNKCICCEAEKPSQQLDSFKKIIQTQKEKWECTTCLTRNDNSQDKCICCKAEKPSQPVDTFKKIIQTQKEKWECTTCLTRNDNSQDKCISCKAEKPSQPVDSIKKIIETQKEKWECTTCLTRNDNSQDKCICCKAENPNQPVDSIKKIIETQKEKWECTTCLTRNDNSQDKCICCKAEKPSQPVDMWQCNFCLTKNNVDTCTCCSAPKLYEKRYQFRFKIDKNQTFNFGIDPKAQNVKGDPLPQTNSLVNTEITGETNNNVLPKTPSFKFGIPLKMTDNEVDKTKNIETSKPNFIFGVVNQEKTPLTSTVLGNTDTLKENNSNENKDNENPQEVPKVDLNANTSVNGSLTFPVASQAQNQTSAFIPSMPNADIPFATSNKPVSMTNINTSVEATQKTSSNSFVPSTNTSSVNSFTAHVNAPNTANLYQNDKPKPASGESIFQQVNVDLNAGAKKTPNMFNFSSNTNNAGQADGASFKFGITKASNLASQTSGVTENANILSNVPSVNAQVGNNPVVFGIPVQKENAWAPSSSTNMFMTQTSNFSNANFNSNDPANFSGAFSFGHDTQNKNPFATNAAIGFNQPIGSFQAPVIAGDVYLNKTENPNPPANIFNTNNVVPQQPFGMQCQAMLPSKFNFGAQKSDHIFDFGKDQSNSNQSLQNKGMWGNFSAGTVAPANPLQVQFNMGTSTVNNPPRKIKRALRRTQPR